MRYIRFLKTPRVVTEKGTSKSQISCLITITSDLGDSFLPYDVHLSAELLTSEPKEEVIVWRTVQWSAGLRSLLVTLPLTKSRASSKLQVRIGFEPGSTYDEFGKLCEVGSCGVVSAWSSEFTPSASAHEAEKLVERRFKVSSGHILRVCEETGESIARHLWDAGITLSCHINSLLDEQNLLTNTTLLPSRATQIQVLELGTGCGLVGITIAKTVTRANVRLTDLAQAKDIVEWNIRQVQPAKGAAVTFQEVDWDAELPANLRLSSSRLDLVIAADCTYNADSSPALVNTLKQLANISPKVKIAIAMKVRHSSEEVFFDLMTEAGFQEITKLDFLLPGDVEVGEETVFVHIYQYLPR